MACSFRWICGENASPSSRNLHAIRRPPGSALTAPRGGKDVLTGSGPGNAFRQVRALLLDHLQQLVAFLGIEAFAEAPQDARDALDRASRHLRGHGEIPQRGLVAPAARVASCASQLRVSLRD